MQQLRQHHTKEEVDRRMDRLLFQIELAAAKSTYERKQQVLMDRAVEHALAAHGK